MKKIFTIILITAVIISCSELNLVNVYNKVTEPYRGLEYDNSLTSPDSVIMVKLIDMSTGKPVKQVMVKLTLPGMDSITNVTDSLGYSRFKFMDIKEGNYTVNATFSKNGKKYNVLENHYMHGKNNPPIIILVTEKNQSE